MKEVTRLFDFVQQQYASFPKEDMFAVKDENGTWRKYSTAVVVDMVNKLSSGLLALGLSGNDLSVDRQDKIAVISRNRPEWLMLDLACQQIGVVLCPVYPTSNINELEFIFKDASVKYIFCSGADLLEKMETLRHRIPSLQNIYCFDKLPECNYWETILQNEDSAKLESLRNSIKATTCATIIYTSGTTGTPKGVMLSHANIVSNVVNSVDSFPFEKNPGGRALSFLPLNHIFERMVSYIYIHSAISIYYAESLDALGENLKEVRPMVFCTVPRLLEKVYEKIMSKGAELTGVKKRLFDWAVNLGLQYDNRKSGGAFYNFQLALANKIIFNKWRDALGGRIQYIITGSAACQVRLLKIFNAAQVPIYEGYGPTENSPVISVNRRGKDGSKFGTVGPVINGQEVKLEPDGEICVKGPSVMMGYYKRPDLTEETIKNGWLHTGDIGVLDEGRFLKITDRKKELFKTSGGKYVAPQPIENKMKESPYVEQMMVVGADQKFVGALIVPSIPNVRNWMRDNDIEFTTAAEALRHPKVIDFFRQLIEAFNEFFNHVEQVKKFELLPDEWTVETGELTPTLKLKRKVIMEKYGEVIRRLYASV